MAERPSYVYVTYIESTPERVWDALPTADMTASTGAQHVSDWQAGSSWSTAASTDRTSPTWRHRAGVVPPRRLAMTFDAPGAAPPRGPSRVTFDIEPYHEIVRSRHARNLADREPLEAISAGWPAVFAT